MDAQLGLFLILQLHFCDLKARLSGNVMAQGDENKGDGSENATMLEITRLSIKFLVLNKLCLYDHTTLREIGSERSKRIRMEPDFCCSTVYY